MPILTRCMVGELRGVEFVECIVGCYFLFCVRLRRLGHWNCQRCDFLCASSSGYNVSALHGECAKILIQCTKKTTGGIK